MRIRFLEIAQIELDETIEYYNYEFVGWVEVSETQRDGLSPRSSRRTRRDVQKN